MSEQGESSGVASTTFRIGQSVARLEDERLLRGEGCYLDDIRLPDQAHAVVLRSPFAHARIQGIDAAAALARPGVLTILTGAELTAAGIRPTEPHATTNVQTGAPFPYEPAPILALDRVRYVGEPVAFVVAESAAIAADAAECIEVDYRALPAVLTPASARDPRAPALSDRVPGNVHVDWVYGDRDGTAQAIEEAAHRVSIEVNNHRIAHTAMEPRGAIGQWDGDQDRYRLTLSTQNVHVIRDHVAHCLAVPAARVQVVAPDVGGGFGVRNFIYPEYVLVAHAARLLSRPVKWVSARSEGFSADHQARDFQAKATLGLDPEGRFVGLEVDCDFNLGAYLIGAGGGVPTGQYCTCPGTVYDIPRVSLQIRAVSTNTVPIGVTRGPGFAEMVDVMERLIDAAARSTGFDRMALRRQNLVSGDRMPWTNSVGTTIDSGDFPRCFEAALAQADVAGFGARAESAVRRGRVRGIGVVNHIKATGGLDEENVHLGFEQGQCVLTTGTQAIGQGHETTFRQIIGSLLGLEPARVRYRAGDSDAIAMGGGHGSSRATYMAGTAMHRAAEEVIDKGRAVAGEMLEVALDDVEFHEGRYRVAGTDRAVTLIEVAEHAANEGRGLDTYHHFRRDAMTYPSGCHVAEVEIDPDTGQCEIVSYVAVDDYGVLVNPMVARAQLQGASAQGIGQALGEQVVYDPETGQLLSGSLMDYALPRAHEVPSVASTFISTHCTTNPLGVKGAGEAGAIAAYPALANAIVHALADFGVEGVDGPATPARVWASIQRR